MEAVPFRASLAEVFLQIQFRRRNEKVFPMVFSSSARRLRVV
jgi:hypothetical protein